MLPILQVGPLAIQFPGLLLLAGIWIGTSLIDREAPRYKLSGALLNNLVFLALVAGILGARLGYALRFFDVYLGNPLDLLSLNPNTLDVQAGLAAAFIAALVYGARKGLPLWPALDALTPSFAVLAIAIGLAHIASGDAFGRATDLPWAIELWGERRHPTQFYETLLAAGILAAALWLRRRTPFSGFVFLTWVALSAAARLLLEAFRGDSVIILGGLRQAQLAGFLILASALLMLHLLARRATVSGPNG